MYSITTTYINTPASKEHEDASPDTGVQGKLERPTNFVDALELDLFKVFVSILETKSLVTTLLDDTFEEDKVHPIW